MIAWIRVYAKALRKEQNLKIEKLNENKLKITLDINDLKSRNIDIKSFVTNTPESQDLFWDVMQEAEQEFGFNVDESMVYVEAHANPQGNFTLFITKTDEKPIQKPKVPTSYKFTRKEFPNTLNNSLFEFTSLENLRDFCKASLMFNYSGTTLYSYNNEYYLYVDECMSKDILEYSYYVPNKDIMLAKINEYGKLLLQNDALEQLIMGLD